MGAESHALFRTMRTGAAFKEIAMNTTPHMRAWRTSLLALATVLACGAASAQDSPGANAGFDRWNRATGVNQYEDRSRHWKDDRRRYSRQERAERDRAERRRIERERQRAERERHRHHRSDAERRGYGLDGETRRRGGEIHSGGG
jgi:hypothetical protein